MKRLEIVVWFALAIACCGAPTVAAEVEITHLANEGFLIEAGETRVLIDALFGAGIRGYGAVPAGERGRLEAGEPPWDGVDLVLASHHHGDHFEARAVAFHLEANPEVLFLSTAQASKRLEDHLGKRWPEVAPRVTAIQPLEHQRVDRQLAGVKVTALSLHHGLDRRPLVENLGLLFELGGLRLLHMGDSEVTREEIEPYRLAALDIDIAFVPSWYFVYDQWLPLLDELGAAQLIAVHLAAPDAPPSYFGSIGGRSQLEARILEARPKALILAQGESRRFGGGAAGSRATP